MWKLGNKKNRYSRGEKFQKRKTTREVYSEDIVWWMMENLKRKI